VVAGKRARTLDWMIRGLELERQGYRVLVVWDFARAVEAVDTHRPVAQNKVESPRPSPIAT